ncbi:MAG TPA: hypothetical protein VHY58_10070 [Streptosporangiaceae bacterium]|jgi:catechol 2,3-dioxygenase-like lactoylglutathione lyase family enzyme|nr:hypothetical protein [Streptosporangiaceae bacterium]
MALLHEIAHLGHAELLTPEPEKSLWFFTEVLGLTENGRGGDSVYLRTWDDYEHHSLKRHRHRPHLPVPRPRRPGIWRPSVRSTPTAPHPSRSRKDHRDAG